MIVVTGAASTVGRAACRQLARTGLPFRACVHRRNVDVGDLSGESVYLDLRDISTVRSALAGADSAFYIPPASPDLPSMTKGFAREAAAAGIGFIVKLSAYGGDEESTSQMGSWHALADAALRESEIPCVLLHCMPFMQNIFYIAETMIKPHGLIMLPCGDARVSHVDARDVAAAACAVFRSPVSSRGREFILTGRAAISYSELAETLSDLLGRDITYRDIPEDRAAEILGQAGLPEAVVVAKLISFRLEKQNRRSIVSTEIKKLTGREPRSFMEFLADHLDYFR